MVTEAKVNKDRIENKATLFIFSEKQDDHVSADVVFAAAGAGDLFGLPRRP
jgi:hypothetical protein